MKRQSNILVGILPAIFMGIFEGTGHIGTGVHEARSGLKTPQGGWHKGVTRERTDFDCFQ